MANVYKTPGVYVEEISTLPASIAQVETAIPAFIGYTEKADRISVADLKLKPTRITSLVQYEQYFGKGPSYTYGTIMLDANNTVTSSTIGSVLYTYESMQLYFANGGGPCYIVSIGTYSDTLAKADFLLGVAALKKYDEPTLILFPDAVKLSATDLGEVQQAAIKQCADLQDRFTICDVKETAGGDDITYASDIDTFRFNIGTKNLKYAAAYTPFINAGLTKTIHYRDIYLDLNKGGAVTVQALTTIPAVITIADNLDKAVSDVDTLGTDIATVIGGGFSDLKDKYYSLVNALKSTTNDAGAITAGENLFKLAYDLSVKADNWVADATILGTSLTSTITTSIANGGVLYNAYESLIALDAGAASAVGSDFDVYTGYSADKDADWETVDALWSTAPTPDTAPYVGATSRDMIIAAEPTITALFETIYFEVTGFQEDAAQSEEALEASLYEQHSAYKKIVDQLAATLSTMPPSGVIAGIYADTDRSRGVWKAPANVSLTGVVSLTHTIDNEAQQDLNVDANTGKSINCIRAFTGKGILVWGARTLAGNDLEWRYVPVRRLFIMIEESIRKATEFVVFEPNDANTWVRVKGMINNFLSELWKQGALAGAKPAAAFFVNCGLGETMTAQDILEGKLIVEIGLAAVRPAEFIILRFSHKLQES